MKLTEVCAKRAVKKYAAEETAHEAIHGGNAKVHATQFIECAAGSHAWLQDGMTNGVKGHWRKAREIKRHTWTGSKATNRRKWMTKRMGNLRETTAVEDFRTGTEGSKVEGRIFQQFTCCAVRREIHLKAAIKAKSINDVGTDAAAHGIGCFKDGPVNAALLQRVRAGKTCKTGSDDRCARHGGIVVRADACRENNGRGMSRVNSEPGYAVGSGSALGVAVAMRTNPPPHSWHVPAIAVGVVARKSNPQPRHDAPH